MTITGNDEANLTKSFRGLRVLDFSTTIAGPHCTRMLADMGAEVIKIEPAEGETMRTRPPVRNDSSTVFGQLNVGKKSLVLDLKSPKAIDVIRRLVASADILVENFRPGVMRRLKLDYASLRELNPGLIYCSISGYGQTGPSASWPAYAPVIHAASGYDMAHLAYQPGRSRPDYCGIYHADVFTGTYAFGAISAALYQRCSTGQGQHIDVSMLESMLEPDPERSAMVAIRGAGAEPADVRAGRDLGRLCHGRDRQREDVPEPRDRGRPSGMDHRSALCEIWRPPRQLDGADGRRRGVVAHAFDRAMPRGAERNGVPSSAYRTVAEALADPQIAHRGALAEVEDGGGTFKVMNLPFRMSGTNVSAGRRAATLGEHTVAYLRESGLGEDEIAAFTGKARVMDPR